MKLRKGAVSVYLFLHLTSVAAIANDWLIQKHFTVAGWIGILILLSPHSLWPQFWGPDTHGEVS